MRVDLDCLGKYCRNPPVASITRNAVSEGTSSTTQKIVEVIKILIGTRFAFELERECPARDKA